MVNFRFMCILSYIYEIKILDILIIGIFENLKYMNIAEVNRLYFIFFVNNIIKC